MQPQKLQGGEAGAEAWPTIRRTRGAHGGRKEVSYQVTGGSRAACPDAGPGPGNSALAARGSPTALPVGRAHGETPADGDTDMGMDRALQSTTWSSGCCVYEARVLCTCTCEQVAD